MSTTTTHSFLSVTTLFSFTEWCSDYFSIIGCCFEQSCVIFTDFTSCLLFSLTEGSDKIFLFSKSKAILSTHKGCKCSQYCFVSIYQCLQQQCKHILRATSYHTGHLNSFSFLLLFFVMSDWGKQLRASETGLGFLCYLFCIG